MNRRSFFQIAAGITAACKVGLPAIPPTIEKKTAGAISWVSGREERSGRFIEPGGGAKTQVHIAAFIPGRQPQTNWYGNEGMRTDWIRDIQNGTCGPWRFLGWRQQDHATQSFAWEIWRPIDHDHTCQVASAIGAIGPTLTVPAGACVSPIFMLTRVGAPAANAVRDAIVTDVKFDDTFAYWGLPDGVCWTNPSREYDPNFFYTALTAQCVFPGGNPAPPDRGGIETLVGQFSNFGRVIFRDIRSWEFNPPGSPCKTMRFRLYGVSRSATGWKDPNFSTLQSTCWDGAAFRDVVFGARPASGFWTWNDRQQRWLTVAA